MFLIEVLIITNKDFELLLGLELALSPSSMFHKKMFTLKFKFDEDLNV